MADPAEEPTTSSAATTVPAKATTKPARVAKSRSAAREKLRRRQQKKKAARTQAAETSESSTTNATTSQSASATASVDTSAPVNGTTPASSSAPSEAAAAVKPKPKTENPWEKKTTPAGPQPRPIADQVRPTNTRPLSNGNARQLGPPTRGPPTRRPPQPLMNGAPTSGPSSGPSRSSGGDRETLFGTRKAAPPKPLMTQPQPERAPRKKMSIQDRLRKNNKYNGLVDSMGDDYIGRDHTAGRRAPPPPTSEMNTAPSTVRPRGPPPTRPTGDSVRPRRNNGRIQQRQTESIATQERPRQKPMRKQPQSNPRPTSSSSTTRSTKSNKSSKSSRSTRSSASTTKSLSATSSSTSSPIRRKRKDLKTVGLKPVKGTTDKKVIRQKSVVDANASSASASAATGDKSAVWLNGPGSLDEDPVKSDLNPEAPMFNSVMSTWGEILTDDHYRPFQPAVGMIPMQPPPVQQVPAQPAPTQPTEPDFSQAANAPNLAFPYHDMFGQQEQYYQQQQLYYSDGKYYTPTTPVDATYANYSTTQTPTGATFPQVASVAGPPPATAYQYTNGTSTSGTTSGTASTAAQSGDYTQMLPPTHYPPSTATTGSSSVVVNGGTQPAANDMTGVSNPVDGDVRNGDDEFIYENATGYFSRDTLGALDDMHRGPAEVVGH